jgi:hypothetical protein
MKNDNHQRKEAGQMWFRGQNVPILYGRGRKNIIASEDWTARGTVQRIGATIFAIGFFCGSVAFAVAGFLVGSKLSENVGGILGQILGTLLTFLAFLVACIGMFLTFRLARGVVRSFYK